MMWLGIPAIKEPSGLVKQDGKQPDGLPLISWQGSKSSVWDATVVHTPHVAAVLG